MSWRAVVVRGLLGGVAWAWLGLGPAQAGVVFPTKLDLTVDASSPVTVSLYQLDSSLPVTVGLQSPSQCTSTGTAFYRDVTDCWLPEWNPASGGKVVYVVVNGSTSAPTLLLPAAPAAFPLASGTANPFVAALTTSAYPGQCTNVGAGADADFAPLGAKTQIQISSTASVDAYPLTPNDCGGMAVVQVVTTAGTTLKFILPKDGTATKPANGIPEVWESLFGGNLDPSADIDTGPVAGSPCCDGISTFDEYRGFIVSGRQIRTDPTQKNVFLHVVNPADFVSGVSVPSPSCGVSCFGGGTTTYPVATAPAATLTLGAGGIFTASSGVFTTAHAQGEIIGNAGGRAQIAAVNSPSSVSVNIIQPFPQGTTSLGQGSWQLRESLFANVYTAIPPERVHLLGYSPGGTNYRTAEWVDNFTSVTPSQILNITDTVTDGVVNANRVYGAAQKGMRVLEGLNVDLPSTLGWAYGIGSPNQAGNVILFAQRIINYITSLIPVGSTLKYSTASVVNGAWTWATPVTVDRNFILSKAFQFYTGMEVFHSLDLTPDVQGTSKTSYGHHFAPGTGDCLDQAITTTAKSGTVTFYIPSLCGSADQSHFDIH
jgi:hypothetical protein